MVLALLAVLALAEMTRTDPVGVISCVFMLGLLLVCLRANGRAAMNLVEPTKLALTRQLASQA